MFQKKQIGKIGEKIACYYLLKNNYIIIGKNVKISHKEIDIIAQKNKNLIFVEVKTTYNNNPKDYISNKKIRLIKQAIDYFCLILAKKQENIRLDFIAIKLTNKKIANISHFKNII